MVFVCYQGVRPKIEYKFDTCADSTLGSMVHFLFLRSQTLALGIFVPLGVDSFCCSLMKSAVTIAVLGRILFTISGF